MTPMTSVFRSPHGRGSARTAAARPRHRRALVLPAGLAAATALALLPGAPAAAAPAPSATTEGTSLSYVVNVRPGTAPPRR